MTDRDTSHTIYLWNACAGKLLERSTVAELRCGLSADERDRADRFRFEIDANRFIAGRFFLRNVLAVHLNTSPRAIKFQTGPNGKPSVSNDFGTGQHFSFSRSGTSVVCAFSSQRRVGVDVEVKTTMPQMDAVAQNVFDATDLAVWRNQDPESQIQVFFRAWTRKEAVCKIDGSGISAGPDKIAVPLELFATGQAQIVEGHTNTIRPVLSDYSFSDSAFASLAFEGPEICQSISYQDTSTNPQSIFRIADSAHADHLSNFSLTVRLVSFQKPPHLDQA